MMKDESFDRSTGLTDYVKLRTGPSTSLRTGDECRNEVERRRGGLRRSRNPSWRNEYGIPVWLNPTTARDFATAQNESTDLIQRALRHDPRRSPCPLWLAVRYLRTSAFICGWSVRRSQWSVVGNSLVFSVQCSAFRPAHSLDPASVNICRRP